MPAPDMRCGWHHRCSSSIEAAAVSYLSASDLPPSGASVKASRQEHRPRCALWIADLGEVQFATAELEPIYTGSAAAKDRGTAARGGL
jgi:hypothetical protein